MFYTNQLQVKGISISCFQACATSGEQVRINTGLIKDSPLLLTFITTVNITSYTPNNKGLTLTLTFFFFFFTK